MQPERLAAWISILRDIVIVFLAAFMLVFATTWIHDPTVLAIVIGGGLALLGVPAALRVDSRRRNTDEGQDDDRWSHLP